MNKQRNYYRAVVISEDHYNALGVLRSLGEAGFDTTLVLLTTGATYTDLCRYVTTCIKIEKSEENIITQIIEEAKKRYYCILFPLCDYAALAIDQHYSCLPQNVLVPHMNGHMNEYLDKNRMKRVAESCGIHVPYGIIIDTGSAIDVGRWNIYPAIIKPLLSVEGVKSDIATVTNLNELDKAILTFRNKGYKRALLEEFITGEDSHMVEVLGYRNTKGATTVSGIVKKIREYPINNGSTAYAEIVDVHNDVDTDLIDLMLNKLGYVGLFDIEYKYANGVSYFIECNFRNGAPSYAFTKIGENIPANWIASNDICGEVQLKNKKENMYFMCEQNDLMNMLKGYVPKIKWLKEYFTSNKVFNNKKDKKPVTRYYWLFFKQVVFRKQ